jgi:large subunit ribosomal protein L22
VADHGDKTMEVQAKNKFVDISPRKARLVLDEVRGRQAEDAIAVLSYMPQHAARVISKTIQSALANAVENFGYDAKDMYVTRIFADGGPYRKWRRFGARGRFKPWRRPTCHITVVLEERVVTPPPAAASGKSAKVAKAGKPAPSAGSN